MAGPLSSFRTPNRPLFNEDGTPVFHETKRRRVAAPFIVIDEETGEEKTVLRVVDTPAQKHVLDYRIQKEAPSKHAAGRSKKMSKSDKTTRDNRAARQFRVRQKATIAANIEAHEQELDRMALDG